ncbi:MAG: hypothetical protein GY910_09645 [bacterium]|nr:hypothetical protein [Deltaproteobacteria bacterium]MCP4905233.1 hypothetical protein [bacterium]
MSEQTIEITPRFCGPPRSGNGGYVSGRLAAFVDAPAVGVRLLVPPPLERPLVVWVSQEGADLFNGETKVAWARPVDFELVAPRAPSFEQAERAARRFRGFEEHVFPGCFVCGTERAEADGLRIFPGPCGDEGLFAAPWIPDASLASPSAKGITIGPEIAWAALDCPGAFAFPQPPGKVILLGEIQAAISGSVSVGERCVLTSWEIEVSGRKHLTGSALHAESGECRGLARGLWFEVDSDAVPRD